MPARMQAAATSAASRALDLFDVADCRAIAGHIKTARPPSAHLSLFLSSPFVRHCRRSGLDSVVLCGNRRFSPRRSSTSGTASGGSAWWEPTLGASSHIPAAPSSTSPWSASPSSSSRPPPSPRLRDKSVRDILICSCPTWETLIRRQRRVDFEACKATFRDYTCMLALLKSARFCT